METAVVERPLLKKWLCFLSQITNGMPASYFGDRSSLVGLANPWGGAKGAWQLPQFIADWISVTGVMRAALVVLCVLNALLVADRLAAG